MREVPSDRARAQSPDRETSDSPIDAILVIDDEPQIRRVVRNALAAGAKKVVEASGGREGIDQAVDRRPHHSALRLVAARDS